MNKIATIVCAACVFSVLTLSIASADSTGTSMSGTFLVAAQGADGMKKETMNNDAMMKDGAMDKQGMKKDDSMMQNGMKKDGMMQDGMKKDDMKKDGMKKDDMGKGGMDKKM